MTLRDHYRILGVSPRAGWEEIRKSFRDLAWRFHPDRNPDNPGAAAQFRQVLEAYEAVGAARSPVRRRKSAESFYVRPGVRVNDELFSEYFGMRRPEPTAGAGTGPDFRYDLRVAFADAVLGAAMDIEVPRLLACEACGRTGRAPGAPVEICPDCQGTGRRALGPGMLRLGPICSRCQGCGHLILHPCGHCHGSGLALISQTYRVTIPSGTEDGTRLSFPGQGGPGFNNRPPGNLEVVISVEPHAFFIRKGNDLHCRFEISFAQATLGGRVRIPTLRGFRTLTLPRRTESGRRFRLVGEGAPARGQNPPGDQVVTVVVSTPRHLTRGQRAILEELARLEQEPVGAAAHE
jgi:molecular chaperone DnaJ